MIDRALPVLLVTMGIAMAVERTLAPGKPAVRELTKREQFMRTQRGQELDRLADFIMQGDVDPAAADRAIQDYRRKYNITGPIGTAPDDTQPGLPPIDVR